MKKISNWLDAINLKELETHLKQVIQKKQKRNRILQPCKN